MSNKNNLYKLDGRVPVAQAVVISKLAPRKPVFMEMVPAAILLIIIGM